MDWGGLKDMRGPVRTDEGAQDLSSLCSLPCGNSGRRRPAAASVAFLGALPQETSGLTTLDRTELSERGDTLRAGRVARACAGYPNLLQPCCHAGQRALTSVPGRSSFDAHFESG